MSVNLNAQQLGAWVARILAVGAAVIAAIPATDVPNSVRPFLALAGGIIIAVDRFVTDPSTGSTPVTPPTPTPASQPAAAVNPPAA